MEITTDTQKPREQFTKYQEFDAYIQALEQTKRIVEAKQGNQAKRHAIDKYAKEIIDAINIQIQTIRNYPTFITAAQLYSTLSPSYAATEVSNDEELLAWATTMLQAVGAEQAQNIKDFTGTRVIKKIFNQHEQLEILSADYEHYVQNKEIIGCIFLDQPYSEYVIFICPQHVSNISIDVRRLKVHTKRRDLIVIPNIKIIDTDYLQSKKKNK